MKLTRLFVLAAATAVLAAGCEDDPPVAPPDPPKSVTHGIHYTKTFDSKGQQNGLQSNDVFAFHVLADGSAWIGNQSGIAVYPNLNTKIRSGEFDEVSGLSNPKIRDMVELGGVVYVATWGGGLSVYDIAGDSWTQVRASANGLTNDYVARITPHEGRLYFATNDGVSIYDPVGDTWNRLMTDPNESVQGDLLDPLVSLVTVSDTPRGKEFLYSPRVEFGLQPSELPLHGITVMRGTFDAATVMGSTSAVKDNTLYEDAAGALSNGAGGYIFSGVGTDALTRTALIAFDVEAAVPSGTAGGRIVGATLRLRVDGGDQTQSIVRVQRVLDDWGEGSSVAGGDESTGAAATNGDATWLHTFYPNVLWRNVGGEFETNASSQIFVSGDNFYQWSGTALRNDVQMWQADPSSNYGWGVVSSGALKRFSSREAATASWRPTLIVSYRPYGYLTTVNSDLAEPNVNDIFYDDVNDLYYICFATAGIGVLDMGAATWTYYTMEEGLPSNVVYSITMVDGTLWVATQEGIARQTASGRWQGYARSGGLKADRVRRVFTDDGARLWLAYVDAGAGRVNPSTAQ